MLVNSSAARNNKMTTVHTITLGGGGGERDATEKFVIQKQFNTGKASSVNY